MKRLVCTFATLGMLIWTCPPARAEWKGELRRDLEWRLAVDNSAVAGPTAVTVHYLIGRPDENEISRDEMEIRSADAGARVQFFFSKPGRNVRRIIIEVDGPKGGTIIVVVDQVDRAFPEQIEGRGTLVFYVVD